MEEYPHTRFLLCIEAARLYVNGLMGSDDVRIALQMALEELDKPMPKNSTQRLMEAKGELTTSKAVVSAD